MLSISRRKKNKKKSHNKIENKKKKTLNSFILEHKKIVSVLFI